MNYVFKNCIVLVFLLVVGCGQDGDVYNVTEVTENSELFQGYFQLNGGSTANCIYLDQKTNGLVDLDSECQSLVTVNPQNKTLGQFPTLSRRNMIIIDGEIRQFFTLNFNSGHDIEEDMSGANITGRRRVDMRIFIKDDRLNIELKIYKNDNNDNLNEVVAVRRFKEL